jgi:NAD(P)-dependent dehydrogenase (short-subunit alcohol dehydrogenase family)
MGRLSGKIVLITGTGKGMGRTAALRFVAEGAKVVGCDIDESAANETLKLARAGGGEMSSLAPVDLTDENATKKWIDYAVDRYGDFDVLYNNAAHCLFRPIEHMSREDWDYNFAHEVTLVFLAIKHAIPVFRRRGGGLIINVGSTSAQVGSGMIANLPSAVSHAATKAAVIGMSRALANELAPIKVRVNTISPGGINTPQLGSFLEDPKVKAMVLGAQLVQRIGEPEDIANAALYLASDEASWLSGAHLQVDGGLVASGALPVPNTEYGPPTPFMPALAGLSPGQE